MFDGTDLDDAAAYGSEDDAAQDDAAWADTLRELGYGDLIDE